MRDAGRLVRGGRLGRGRRDTFEDEVRIAPAESEGADPGQGRTVVIAPRLQLARHPQPEALEGDMRVGLAEVQARWDGPMLQREGHLDQARDPGRRLQVADVGLRRADHERPIRGPAHAEHGTQGLGLDRVAEERARAVGLDVLHPPRRHTGPPVGVSQDGLLRPRARGRQAVGAPVLVDGPAADHRIDRVAIRPCRRERLEDDQAGPLAPDVAVGPRVERLAAAVGGEEARPREARRDLRREDQVDPAGQGERGLARVERPAGQVDGHERRGAGRVDGQARPPEIEQVRQAIGRDARRVARQVVDVARPGAPAMQPAVVVRRDPDEDAHRLAGEPLRGLAGVLEGLPGDLHQEPLLRVDARRLAGRDAEERGVELVHASHEPAPSMAVMAVRRGRRVVPIARRPAVGRHFADGVDAVAEEAPEGFRSGGAGEAAADADDGDRLVLRLGRAAFAPGSRGDGTGTVRQVTGQFLDRRILIGEGGRERPAQPLLQLAGEASRLERAEAVGGELPSRIDLIRPDPDHRGDASGQPCSDLRRGATGRVRVGPTGRCPVGPLLAEIDHGLRDDLQGLREEPLAAGMAPDLAAGGPREAHRPEQADGVDIQLMPFGHGPPDGRDGLVGLPAGMPFDLLDDDQPLLPAGLDGEGRPGVRAQGGVALPGRPLEVLRVDVAAPDDDQVLEPAGDEQLAVAEDAQVAGPEERPRAGVGRAGAERPLGLLGPPPVAPGDARARDPDLADCVRRGGSRPTPDRR